MERCDFCSAMKIIREYIRDEGGLDQSKILECLFSSFFQSNEGEYFDLDNGLVCRWLNGQTKLSPKISSYYLSSDHKQELANDIENEIVPLLVDMDMVIQRLYELVLHDNSISNTKKEMLFQGYPCQSLADKADFLADILSFCMERTFVKRDAKTKDLLAQGRLSPIIRDYIVDSMIPKPCKWFCGRSAELEQVHTLLETKGKVFIYGIAGIGKSELAKAYAERYRKSYTNILYLNYSGNLKQDITDMDFIEDMPTESLDERFRKHNRFLRSLKEDTLFVIDNFNSTETQDSFLSVVLKYRCHILFTTRSKIAERAYYLLEEISDREVLFGLFAHFYTEAQAYRSIVEQIIETVHSHTFAVELAARLLERGMLSPSMLLQKLQTQKTAMDATDEISADKDGRRQRATYYGHIHTLFSLYQLSEREQNILRGLSLVPLSGIPARQFAQWMGQSDMNTINDLIEMGFIQERSLRIIGLHPMMQEITVTDTKPSVTNCHTLLQNLQQICLRHGHDLVNYKILFQTIENAVALLERDDEAFFLLFIEDAIPYMEKYRYEPGIFYLLKEMETLLDNPDCGKNTDRALLLDFTALYEGDFRGKTEKAIKLEKDALALLPEITAENAHLAANLYVNLGGLYEHINKFDLAQQHMEKGLLLLEQYGLFSTNDAIIQTVNCAMLMGNMGQAEQGLNVLRKCAASVEKYNSDQCLDYATLQEAIGYLYLMMGQIKMAEQHLDIVRSIYRDFYADEPERLTAKEKEIYNAFQMTGINIAKNFLQKYKYYPGKELK